MIALIQNRSGLSYLQPAMRGALAEAGVCFLTIEVASG
jgi:hypothetical protein